MITEKDVEKIERAFLKKQLGEKTTGKILYVSKSMKCGRKLAQRYLFCSIACGAKCEIDKEDVEQNTQYEGETARAEPRLARRTRTTIARPVEGTVDYNDPVITLPETITEATAGVF